MGLFKIVSSHLFYGDKNYFGKKVLGVFNDEDDGLKAFFIILLLIYILIFLAVVSNIVHTIEAFIFSMLIFLLPLDILRKVIVYTSGVINTKLMFLFLFIPYSYIVILYIGLIIKFVYKSIAVIIKVLAYLIIGIFYRLPKAFINKLNSLPMDEKALSEKVIKEKEKELYYQTRDLSDTVTKEVEKMKEFNKGIKKAINNI